MKNGDKTADNLQMAAVEEGNHTPAVDDIDWLVSHNVCLHQWQFVNNCPMILNSLQGCVACQIGHPVESYSLSLVDIHLSTSSVSNDGGKLQLIQDVLWDKFEYG